jgi:purine-nucleoside phosphorylase
MPSEYRKRVQDAAHFLQPHLDSVPCCGILTGTGLADSVAGMDVQARFDYQEIPHFPAATVESHRGCLLAGDLDGRPVVALQGRLHLYEGYTAREVVFPIRVLQELGVKTLIVSNAAGGVTPSLQTGDVMVIRDHINLTGSNPLVGPNWEPWGPRFPDMSVAYDAQLAQVAQTAAEADGARSPTGTYAGLRGPSLETPAEVRFLRTIGADAVGFSTVMEVITAVHAGMRILGLSTITNVHRPERPEPSSIAEIIAVAEAATGQINRIITQVMAHL